MKLLQVLIVILIAAFVLGCGVNPATPSPAGAHRNRANPNRANNFRADSSHEFRFRHRSADRIGG
jgi:hypothetical protein